MSMPSFGDKLRQERESRNLSVDEIAERTAIDPRFLRALERNEFDALPGRAFGKFYIRAYAEILGFDPRTLISDYDAERVKRQRPARAARSAREPPRRRVESAMARWREQRSREQAEKAPSVEQLDHAPERAETPADPEVEAPRVAPVVEASETASATPRPSADDDPADPPPEPPLDSDRVPARAASAHEPREPTIVPDVEDRAPTGVTPETPVTLPHAAPGEHDETAALSALLGTTGPASRSRRLPVGRMALVCVAAIGVLATAIVIVFSLSSPAPRVQPVSAEPRRVVPQPADNPPPRTAVTTPLAADPAPTPERTDPGTNATRPAPADAAPDRVTIAEHGVGRRVVDHRLREIGERFEEGSVVFFWTRVLGGSRGETIRHVWLRDGRPVQTVPLRLGGAHWRTHSRKTLHGIGPWAVEARDADGRVLARTSFDCVPAGR